MTCLVDSTIYSSFIHWPVGMLFVYTLESGKVRATVPGRLTHPWQLIVLASYSTNM